jgi:hypothetical protein
MILSGVCSAVGYVEQPGLPQHEAATACTGARRLLRTCALDGIQ